MPRWVKIATPGAIVLAWLLSTGVVVAGEPGTLDRSFSGDGVKVIDFGSRDIAEHVSVDNAGRITISGTPGDGIPLARLLNDGRLDRSFAGNGKRVADPIPGADAPVAWAMSEGRLIVFGSALGAHPDYYLMRFRADGRTDRSFGRDGVVTGRFASNPEFRGMATLPNGRIVIMGGNVGGETHLKAYNPDGTRAWSFGDRGTAVVDGAWSSLVYHPDGRLLLGALRGERRFVIHALRPNGTRDDGFGNNGRASMAFDSGPSDDISNPSVAVLADGDIAFVTGAARHNFTDDTIVGRFNADGSRATEFGGGDGWRMLDTAPIEYALAIAPMPDGGMILGGFASDSYFDHKPGELLLVAIRPSGRLWRAFGDGGVVRTNLGFQSDVSAAYAVVHDGKLLVAGLARRDMLVARFDL